ncbi:MAG: peptidoglycan bridge formation glycyltransferase FemA/FemB family protein [Candidatus Shapirobacteria bacterium]
MITRILYIEEKDQYNALVKHPLQTWEWGDFQITQGHKVYRLGVFEENKMISVYSVSFHKVPKVNYSIGTLFRGPKVDEEMITNIKKIAQDENAIFVKFEPNVFYPSNMQFPGMKVSPKVAFYPYNFIVDLTKSENKLLEDMHPKTRYNIRIANRYGVEIKEQTDDEGFEIYLKLLFDTTKRQGFYLHTENYHRTLWKTLKDTGMVKIMLASYQGKVLSSFMLFKLKKQLYYPFGASLDTNREVMAPTLLMWESIKLGQKLKCKSFDMWGCLGPNAKESEQGYGFHRFKQGFNGELVQYVGTYDFVINDNLYKTYKLVDKYRWKFLRLKAKLLRK